MCHYDQIIFACGCWKWSHFRKHCQAEYRMGETCGMKFTYNTLHDNNKCTICQSLDKKNRRYAKAMADYQRWIHDPTKQASAAKARDECAALYKEIETLTNDREARRVNVGSNRGPPRGNVRRVDSGMANGVH